MYESRSRIRIIGPLSIEIVHSFMHHLMQTPVGQRQGRIDVCVGGWMGNYLDR